MIPLTTFLCAFSNELSSSSTESSESWPLFGTWAPTWPCIAAPGLVLRPLPLPHTYVPTAAPAALLQLHEIAGDMRRKALEVAQEAAENALQVRPLGGGQLTGVKSFFWCSVSRSLAVWVSLGGQVDTIVPCSPGVCKHHQTHF